MVSQSSTKDHKGIEIGKSNSQALEEVCGVPSGVTQGCQGRGQTEGVQQDLPQAPLPGSTGGVLWCSQAKDGFIKSNQKKVEFW